MRCHVHSSLIVLSAVMACLVPPAAAQDTLLGGGSRPPASSDRVVRSAIPPDRAKALDAEFAALAAAKTAREAHGPERRILAALNHSGSDTVDLLMGWAGAALTAKNYAEALDLLDQVLILDPDYAEGYNRRATVYYALDDYTQSMRDIRFTLALEPRHFGALSGLAAILRELGDDTRAAEIYKRILAIHPTMEAPKTELEKLESTTKGAPT
jgi:tetratricopeptide (TPR) repeat protein